MKLLFATGTALALALAAPALAVPITYTLDGTFSGTLQSGTTLAEPSSFIGTITGVGDTDNGFINPGTGTAGVTLQSLRFDSADFTGTVLLAPVFNVSPDDGTAFFSDEDGNGPAFRSQALVGYYGSMSIGPVGVLPVDLPGRFLSFADAGGLSVFRITGFESPLVFTAQVADAVPEPATWGTMLLGFGLVGAALRRRRAAAVTA